MADMAIDKGELGKAYPVTATLDRVLGYWTPADFRAHATWCASEGDTAGASGALGVAAAMEQQGYDQFDQLAHLLP
ncbi:hypothetical protein FOS14_05860 [Skermania sp. ID1734]|uniref:hypothetical protein n=1 Tax=Skermania sp. ID1734 TaxID=2597516 RepID=UPI00117DE11C|nr:hypothetical protein [Skermania sp. ID1734]TSE00573.1 hypothetical protein FOS14_05860 [Skermania sp. ID1734]